MAFYNEQTEKNFSPLYKRMYPGLTQYAYGHLHDEEAANDVVQATFVKAWTKIGQYDPHWNFSTWIYRIAFNECMQHIRKAKTVMPLFENYDFAGYDGMEPDEPDWDLNKEEDQFEALHKAVIESIHGLPEGLYKSIMVDRELNGLKYHEISEKYGININSVKTRISRARDMVQKAAYKRIYGEDEKAD
jgi:RNA polymerase sigma-70 factor (ECF subfamily)